MSELKISNSMKARLFKITAPELFDCYARACPSENNTWDLLTVHQQKGWVAVSKHIESLAEAVLNPHDYPRHD